MSNPITPIKRFKSKPMEFKPKFSDILSHHKESKTKYIIYNN